MTKQIINCKNCGKEFIDFFSNKRKFCSKNCWYKSPDRKSLSLNFKDGKPNCIECSKKLANYGGKLCKSCCKKGNRTHLWKGGIIRKDFKKNNQQRILFRNLIRKKVIERDNYTCQVCKKRGGNLQVDHIQPWTEFVESRFDMSNCRTVCISCHYYLTYNKSKPKESNWGNYLIGGN